MWFRCGNDILTSVATRKESASHGHKIKEKRIMARKVDEAKCVGCVACAGACPAEAIAVADKATIDAAKCVDCGACEGACPAEAITAA